MCTRSSPLHPRLLCAAFLLTACAALPVRAQFQAQAQQQQRGGVPMGGQSYPPPTSRLPGDMDNREPDPMRDKMEAARQKGLQDDRRKHLESDVNKLLALATELKTEVDKTTKDELSVTVVKKAGEMEKLAHDLKERMRN